MAVALLVSIDLDNVSVEVGEAGVVEAGAEELIELENTDVLVGAGPVIVTKVTAVEVTVVRIVVEEASCANAKRGVRARRRKEMRMLKSILIW